MNWLRKIASQKIILATLAIGVLISVAGGLILLRQKLLITPSLPAPLPLSYCAAIPEEICILAFGRSANGDALISLFVPDQDFPEFHLSLIKYGTESLYQCIKSKELSSTVLCQGEAFALKTTLEITLLSNSDNAPLAKGKFYVKSFLITAGEPLTPVAPRNTPSAQTPTKQVPTAGTIIRTPSPTIPPVYPYP